MPKFKHNIQQPQYDPTMLTIFISYSWGDKTGRPTEVMELAESLRKKRKFNVLLNSKDNSPIDEIHQAIDVADVVLISFSSPYMNNVNCNKEATYAVQRKKPIVPIRMQPGCQPNGSWLSFLIRDQHVLEFRKDFGSCERFADDVTSLIFRLFDKNNQNNFRTIGIDVKRFGDHCYKNLDYAPKLVAIKRIHKGGLMVVTGDERVGKTYLMSLLLLQPENYGFLVTECNVGTAIWVNCHQWRQERDFHHNKDAKEQLKAEVLKKVAAATKRGVSLPFQEHVRILKHVLKAPPLFIFDDVVHFTFLAFIQQRYCKTSPCIAIVRTNFCDIMRRRLQPIILSSRSITPATPHISGVTTPLFDFPDQDLQMTMMDISPPATPYSSAVEKNPFDAIVDVVETVEPLPPDVVESFFEKIPPQNKIVLPSISSTGPTPIPDDSRKQPEETKLILINVPNLGTKLFPRPCEKEALQKAIQRMAEQQGDVADFFIIDGCIGIGKTTLISNIFRDSKIGSFFQRKCNIQVVIWLNCYQWHDGFDVNKQEERRFVKQLLKLGLKANANFKDKYKTLQQMIDIFAKNSLRIVFVLDDVFHYSIVDAFRREAPSALCCVITPDSYAIRGPATNDNFPQEDKTTERYTVPSLGQSEVVELLKREYKLKDKLRSHQISELAKRSLGLPLLLSLLGGHFNSSSNFIKTYNKVMEGFQASENPTPSNVFLAVMKSLPPQILHRFYTVLLFEPSEDFSDKCLCRLWCFDDISYVHNVCKFFEKYSLLQSRKACPSDGDDDSELATITYSVHPSLHKWATEIALKEFRIDEKTDRKSTTTMSNLRAKLLLAHSLAEETAVGTLAKLLTLFRRLSWQLAKILRNINNESFEFIKKHSISGLLAQDYEEMFRIACGCGHRFLAACLIEKIGVNVNAPDSGGRTALMISATEGRREMVEFLIVKGAKLELEDQHGKTALFLAAWAGHENIVGILIYAKLDLSESELLAAFMTAISQGNEESVKVVLRKGVEIDAASNLEGKTALMIAARWGHLKIAELLLENGAGIEARDKKGETALVVAAEFEQWQICELLISRGADVNSADFNGDTALIKAAKLGRVKCVQFLISKGANVDLASKSGKTALMKAVEGDHEEVVKLLLAKGANLDLKDHNDKTALTMAVKWGNQRIFDLLLEADSASY